MKRKTIATLFGLMITVIGHTQGLTDTVSPRSADDSVMSRHYNSLAWHGILSGHLRNVEYYLLESIRLDSLSPYPRSNLPLYFLLTGRYNRAKRLYLEYKDRPFVNGRTFRDEFLMDFREIGKAGITNRNIRKIIALLK